MSSCEKALQRLTLKNDMTRVSERITAFLGSGENGELRQVYSSPPFIRLTSHDQQGVFFNIKTACIITESNGSQFRQVYSSFPVWSGHFQRPQKSNQRMHNTPEELTSNWASLFVNLFLADSLFSSSEAYQKISLYSISSPISITSKHGLFSIAHTE